MAGCSGDEQLSDAAPQVNGSPLSKSAVQFTFAGFLSPANTVGRGISRQWSRMSETAILNPSKFHAHAWQAFAPKTVSDSLF